MGDLKTSNRTTILWITSWNRVVILNLSIEFSQIVFQRNYNINQTILANKI